MAIGQIRKFIVNGHEIRATEIGTSPKEYKDDATTILREKTGTGSFLYFVASRYAMVAALTNPAV